MSTNPFSPPAESVEASRYKPLGILTGIVVTALALDAILLVSNTAATLALAARDPELLAGGEPRDALSTLLAVLAFLGSVLYLLCYVAGGIFFLVWLSRANHNVWELGARDLEFTPGWIVGWFFVPLFNLFRPYEAVDELYLASDPASGPDDWGAAEAPKFILAWWLAWIGFGVSGAFSGVVGGTSVWAVPAAALGCLASGLAIVVVLSIHRRQREKAARGALGRTPAPEGPHHRFL